jgi:hypothetical protein
MEDFLSVMLSGAGGAVGGYKGHMDYKKKQEDAAELAKIKGQSALEKSVLSSIAGAAAKQAMKSGKAIDFSDLAMGGDDMVLTMIKDMFAPGAVGTGGATTVRPNPNGGSVFGPPVKNTGNAGGAVKAPLDLNSFVKK